MTKTHTTLRPNTNILLILLCFFLCSILFISITDKPYILIVLGTVLGAIGGIMQTLSFNEAKESFLDTATMMEVREKLKETNWGKKYIYFLWCSNALLVIVALNFTTDPVISIMIGYFTLMFIREVITLKPTYELENN